MEVGQKVYLGYVGYRHKLLNEVREREITKIGRLYFYVGDLKFKLSDFEQVTQLNIDWKVYLSMQEIENERESDRLFSEIRHKFDGVYNNGNFTLDQLRQIKRIIDGGEEAE